MPTAWALPAICADAGRRDAEEAELKALMAECRAQFPGLAVNAVLHDGRAPFWLAEYAGYVDAALIAVGAADHGVMTRLVTGSTVTELLRTAARPVVAVRDATPVQQAAMAIGGGPVVAGVHDPRTDGPVLDFAFDYAACHGTELRIVCARAFDHRYLRGWRKRFPTVPVTADAVPDRPAAVLLDHSEEALLLVIGNRRYGTIRRLLHGSVNTTVTHRASCSVAVVPRTTP